MEENTFTPVKKPSLGTRFIKRAFDICSSGAVILVIIPFFILFTPIVTIAMKGNPFFTQERPGKKEKIFKLIKFRSMNNKKDENGNLLSDEERLGKYGKFLRATSLDELPELFNIFIGNMSIVGPRPLLVKYLPYYTERQHHRHDVRPGLTGYAQAHGRNSLDWDAKFEMDLKYIEKISLFGDIAILFATVFSVLKREGISQEGQATMEDFTEYVKAKRQNNE